MRGCTLEAVESENMAKKVTAKKKTAPKKPVASKKSSAKAAAPKKAPAKKAAPKKTAAKSAAKAAPKKAAPKAAPKKAAPKAAAPKKAVPKKAAAPKKAMAKATPPKKPAPKKPLSRKNLPFAVNDLVVYPTHGVGQVTGIEEQEIAGDQLLLFVVYFDKDKMTVRVPVQKITVAGMRKLSTPKVMDNAITTLKGRARVKRTMWSRRAQEYEAKINSGDPVLIAEVLRDLHRGANQPEQSYSERQIYEAAMERLVREVAAVEKTDEDAATLKLQGVLEAETKVV